MSLRIAATPESLQEVSFVNPNAQQARCHRRRKLAASRARISAMAASGLGFPGGGDGFAAACAGDQSNVRKQKRMLRNRESAALSRKRKNDLIGELEIQVEALKEENRRLRQRVDGYESDGPSRGGMDLEPLPLTRQRARVRAPGITSASSKGSISPPIIVVSPSPPPRNNFFDPAASPWGSATTTAATAAAACFNTVSRPAVETTAMQQQQQQQYQQQPVEWIAPAEEEVRSDGGGQHEGAGGIWTSFPPTAVVVEGGEGGAGSFGEADASTDGESGSFSFDSDDTDSALDYLFVELMTEDVPGPGALEGGEDGDGGGRVGAAADAKEGADGDLALLLDGKDDMQVSPCVVD